MQESFGNIEMQRRVRRDTALMKAHALIDWEALRPLLKGLYKREVSRAGGQEPYDPLLMFKATLLGQWHCLSDPKLEHALSVRIDFMSFCGLKLDDAAPDESTLCRFRNRLIAANKLTPLMAAVNAQLQGHGLMVQKATGAIIDATLVVSAARPRSQTTIETIETNEANVPKESGEADSTNTDTGTSANTLAQAATVDSVAVAPDTLAAPEAAPVSAPATATALDAALTPTVTETKSVDPDASWLKKGSKSTFGYRAYVSVDAQDGYIRGVHSAPANQGETTHFAQAVASTDFKPNRVYADKGFASAANRTLLQSLGIKSALMHKAQRNTPLTQRQKNANKKISKTRYIVEQCFGTMKRLFGMARASYMGTAKVNGQFMLKAMCLNLLKAANKITLIDEKAGEVRPI